jgi:uncharacterized protein YhhL (DUF1145 family)
MAAGRSLPALARFRNARWSRQAAGSHPKTGGRSVLAAARVQSRSVSNPAKPVGTLGLSSVISGLWINGHVARPADIDHLRHRRLSRSGNLRLGEPVAFFAHSALVALAIVLLAHAVAALVADGNLSPGRREDRANRWVIVAFGLIELFEAYLPAWTDRNEPE